MILNNPKRTDLLMTGLQSSQAFLDDLEMQASQDSSSTNFNDYPSTPPSSSAATSQCTPKSQVTLVGTPELNSPSRTIKSKKRQAVEIIDLEDDEDNLNESKPPKAPRIVKDKGHTKREPHPLNVSLRANFPLFSYRGKV